MPALLVIITAVLLITFAPWVTLAVAAFLAWWLIVANVKVRQVDAAQRGAYEAELASRADLQNAAVLAGDSRGVYGEFPPALLVPPAL